MRDNEVEALADLSVALARAPDLETAALPLVEKVQSLLDVGAGRRLRDRSRVHVRHRRAGASRPRGSRLVARDPARPAQRAVGRRERRVRGGADRGLRRRQLGAREPAAGAGDGRAERGLGADPRERAGRRRPRRRIDLEKAGVQPAGARPAHRPDRRGRPRARAHALGRRARGRRRARAAGGRDRAQGARRARPRERGRRRDPRARVDAGTRRGVDPARPRRAAGRSDPRRQRAGRDDRADGGRSRSPTASASWSRRWGARSGWRSRPHDC